MNIPFSFSSSANPSPDDQIHHHYQPLEGVDGDDDDGGGGGVDIGVTFGGGRGGANPHLEHLQRRGRESRPLMMGASDDDDLVPASANTTSFPLYQHTHRPAPPPASSFMFYNDHLGGNNNNNNNHRHQNNAHHGSSGVSAGNTEDSLLWDQLNDEQSREVQQHQSRFRAAPLTSRQHPWNIVWSMTQSTAERVGNTAYSAWYAARVAWNQYPARRRRQQQQRSSSSNGRGQTIDDVERQFGIHDLRGSTAFDDIEGGMFDDGNNNSSNNGDRTNENGGATTARRRRNNDNGTNSTQIANGKPNPNYPFVMLRNFPRQMIHQSEEESWGIVSNLDVFLTHLYQYYYHRGVVPMICSFLVEIISLFITLLLSRMLFKNVDWSLVITCKDETTCLSHWSDYYYTSDYSTANGYNNIGWMHWLLVQGYTLLFLLYGTFRCWTFWQSLQHAFKCQYIVHDKLGISKRKLLGGAITWDEIVIKLCQVQASGEYKFALPQGTTVATPTTAAGAAATSAAARVSPVVATEVTAATSAIPEAATTATTKGSNDDDDHLASSADTIPSGVKSRLEGESVPTVTTTTRKFSASAMNGTRTNNSAATVPAATIGNGNEVLMDPLWIAQRIMRKENFLIAFFNQGLLDTKVGSRYYWCPSLEWSVYTCVLNFMFNHKYEIRPAFYLDPTSLQRRFVVCGIIHAILLPFLIMFVVLHFILRNVYDMKTTRQYMGDKQWSSYALWTFREFNELPHMFEQRLEPSYEAAEHYLKLFGTAEWMAAVGKLLVFIGGAIGGVLLLLGVMNDAILMHVQYAGRNLFWYAGMAGIVYSIGKALLPIKEATPSVSTRSNLFTEMDDGLKRIATFTHYYPEYWKHRGWDTKNVYTSFKLLFDSRVKLFLIDELVGLLLTPYILIVKLPNCSDQICEFCLSIKTRIPNAGEVCGYSTFDFDRFGDEDYEYYNNINNNSNHQTATNHNDNHRKKKIDTRSSSILLVNETKNKNNNNNNAPGETLAQSILRTGNVEDATRLHPKPRSKLGKMKQSFWSFQIMAHPTNRNFNITATLHGNNNSNGSNAGTASATINDEFLNPNRYGYDTNGSRGGGGGSIANYNKEDDESRRNSARLLFSSSVSDSRSQHQLQHQHVASQHQLQQRQRQQQQQDWMTRFENFQRQEELRAMTRERQLYIEAAARQLETLERLEKQQQQYSYGYGGPVTEVTETMKTKDTPSSSSPLPSLAVPQQQQEQSQQRPQQQRGYNARQYIPPKPMEAEAGSEHRDRSQSLPGEYDSVQKKQLKSPPPTTPTSREDNSVKGVHQIARQEEQPPQQRQQQQKAAGSAPHTVHQSPPGMSPRPTVSPPSTRMLKSIKPRLTPQRNGSGSGSASINSTPNTRGRSGLSTVGSGAVDANADTSTLFTSHHHSSSGNNHLQEGQQRQNERDHPQSPSYTGNTVNVDNENDTNISVPSPAFAIQLPTMTDAVTTSNKNVRGRRSVPTTAAISNVNAHTSSVQYYNDASESVFYEAVPSTNNNAKRTSLTTTTMARHSPTATTRGAAMLNPIATSQLMTTISQPAPTDAADVVADSNNTTSSSLPIARGQGFGPDMSLMTERTIEGEDSRNNSNLPNPIPWTTTTTEDESGTDRRSSERQYYWLERFHEHLEEQQRQEEEQQEQQQQHTPHASTRSLPSYFALSASSPMTKNRTYPPNLQQDQDHRQQSQHPQRLYQSLNFQNLDSRNTKRIDDITEDHNPDEKQDK